MTSGPVVATRPTTGWVAWLRRNRGITAIVLVIVLVVLALSVLTARSTTRGEDLDPDNPSPNGAQAVARVLAQHGIHLTVVRRAAELAKAPVDADTTVVVTSPDNLGRTTADQVGKRAAEAGQVVLAGPGPTLIRAFRLPVAAAPAHVDRRAESGCDDPLVGDLTLEVGPSTGYRSTGSNVSECFQGRGHEPGSLIVRVDRSLPVYAVGGTGLFTNDRVDRADNAAAALRLLGAHPRLLWYVPDSRDIALGDAGSFSAQLPRGLFPSLWLLAAAAIATMLWRGRRLGPLVVEPLPVVVKAVESTQGRGRLYRRVRDRSHAATVLRTATLRRLVTRLRLPSDSDPWHVAVAVARSTGRDPRSVHDVLVDRPVAGDPDLIRLAGDLTALEKEVHDA